MKLKFIKIPAYGNSMYPFFISGDILYIQSLSFSKITVNDFVTFVEKNVFITHRVIYIPPHKKYVLTKGDSNPEPDKKVSPQRIIGKVVKVERNGKTFTPETLYTLQSFTYYKEICRINKLFQKNNINFVFLKGLPLHLYFEKSIPNRIYGDCDILIAKNQLTLVEDLLNKQGYKKEKSHFSSLHKFFKNKETEINFTKYVKNIPINLDIHVEPSFMMHQIGSLNALYSEKLLTALTSDVLSNKRIIFINGIHYQILASHHLIIYLALHLFHHNLQGYYRYEFLQTILQKEKLDLAAIKKCVSTYKLHYFVFPVFSLLWKKYKNIQAKKIISLLQLPTKKRRIIENSIKSIDIFNEETRIASGIKRFKLIYSYSPNNIFKKMTVIFSLPILYSILWVFTKRIQKRIIFLKDFSHQYGSLLSLKPVKKQSA